MKFSHSSVEGIVLWGFWAGSHWRAPDAALVAMGWTVNAAGRRFEALMAEWWSNETIQTDAAGIASSRVFHGSYRITVDAPGSPAAEADERVASGAGGTRQIAIDPM